MERPKQTPVDQFFLPRMRTVRRIFGGLFLLILATLFKLQIIDYKPVNRIVKLDISVARGTIRDRNGRVLAMSLPTYSLYLDYWMVDHRAEKDPGYPAGLKKAIGRLLGMSAAEVEAKTKRPYPMVRRALSVDEYRALKAAKLPGLVFYKAYRRFYPQGQFACHVLGCTNVDDRGIEGIELQYDGLLRGRPGLSYVVRDGSGGVVPSLEKVIEPPESGRDVHLTIDSTIQSFVEEAVDEIVRKSNPAGATVVVMQPETGEILALANRPAYDCNAPGASPVANRRNRALTDLFEPGSVFKIVTAAACFEDKKVRPGEIIHCEGGKWYVRNHWLHDAHGYGGLAVEDVIVKSSNIGTVKLAMRVGEDRLYHYCRLFGFGAVTGMDLPGEIPGILRPLSRWSGFSITAIPIGQEVGINSLQGARAMAVLANGGMLVRPHVLKALTGSGEPMDAPSGDPPARVLSAETAAALNAVLERVAAPGGTAPQAQIVGYRVCGKTGTAQKCINGVFSHSRFVASFLGYVMRDGRSPVIVSVNVDEPKGAYYGGVVAAPAFRDVVWRVLQHWDLPPDEDLRSLQLASRKHAPQGTH